MQYKYNDNFVPVNVYRDNYDEVAEDFLKHYEYQKALTTPMPVPIYEIARKRMGLEVYTTQQLSQSRDILGTIAFEAGDVEVYDPGTKSVISFGVKRGTVLIDCTINHEGRENNTMAHECVHWYIHRYYFDHLLKKTVDSDIAFRCPVKGITDTDDSIHDEERMEKQARGIAPRILMPKEATNVKIRELLDAYGYTQDMPDRIGVLTQIVDELAEFFKVSKTSAKYRMVDLGFMNHADSKEVYNYESNGVYDWNLDEHPLTVKTSNRPLTRHITIEHAFYEYSRNAAFREMLQSGYFRFVEDAFVINHPKYIYQDEEGKYRLTKYAIEHQQECTLLFEYAINLSYGSTEKPTTTFSFLTSVETNYKKLPRYVSNVNNDATFDVAKALDAVSEEFENFKKERTATAPATGFWDRTNQIMTAKGISLSKFKADSGLNDATVSRLRLNQTTVTMRVGVAVCFGLNIDITESRRLLELARLTLNNDAECLAYEFVITNFKDCPLFEKNDILAKFGIDPIGTRSADE
jgi:Zn-dependent peptidase ImmA (M78 family)/transcriptional regulator with XRE-family HTH domain